MKILYVGDIMGAAGIQALREFLPGIQKEHAPDLVIAQAENLSDGKGISTADFKTLRNLGIDFCTGGNWTMYRDEIFPALNDPAQPVVRPANYPAGTPGLGYKYVRPSKAPTVAAGLVPEDAATQDVLVISLLGQIVGRDADKPTDNPLDVIDAILQKEQDRPRAATVVNFHGDFSSEKRVIGYYLDGRVTAVIGDHWHVPTADAMVLPDGTAHQTDVGMCGSLHSSLGVSLQSILPRWKYGKQTVNVLAEDRPYQFNAVLIETKLDGLASSVTPINLVK